MDPRIGGRLVQEVLHVPVVPLLWTDGLDPASEVVEQYLRDEVHEQPAFPGLLAMDIEPVAVQKVLHVVEVLLDIDSAIVMVDRHGSILLRIGEDHPVAAAVVDVLIHGLLVEKDPASSLRSILHGEVGTSPFTISSEPSWIPIIIL